MSFPFHLSDTTIVEEVLEKVNGLFEIFKQLG